LLTTPEFTIYKTLVNLQPSWHAGKKSDEGFSVGLSCCKVTEHRYWIVSDEIEKLAPRFQIETNLKNFSRDEWDESLVQYF